MSYVACWTWGYSTSVLLWTHRHDEHQCHILFAGLAAATTFTTIRLIHAQNYEHPRSLIGLSVLPATSNFCLGASTWLHSCVRYRARKSDGDQQYTGEVNQDSAGSLVRS